jgi:hypothetical protein
MTPFYLVFTSEAQWQTLRPLLMDEVTPDQWAAKPDVMLDIIGPNIRPATFNEAGDVVQPMEIKTGWLVNIMALSLPPELEPLAIHPTYPKRGFWMA